MGGMVGRWGYSWVGDGAADRCAWRRGGGSYWREGGVRIRSSSGEYSLIIRWGRVVAFRWVSYVNPGWDVHYVEAADWTDWDGGAKYHWGGFVYDRNPAGVVATVPLWLVTALAAGLAFGVWRKTRGKYNGKGFPVEIAGKERVGGFCLALPRKPTLRRHASLHWHATGWGMRCGGVVARRLSNSHCDGTDQSEQHQLNQ